MFVEQRTHLSENVILVEFLFQAAGAYTEGVFNVRNAEKFQTLQRQAHVKRNLCFEGIINLNSLAYINYIKSSCPPLFHRAPTLQTFSPCHSEGP